MTLGRKMIHILFLWMRDAGRWCVFFDFYARVPCPCPASWNEADWPMWQPKARGRRANTNNIQIYRIANATTLFKIAISHSPKCKLIFVSGRSTGKFWSVMVGFLCFFFYKQWSLESYCWVLTIPLVHTHYTSKSINHFTILHCLALIA